MKIVPSLSCALLLCALPAFASVTVTSPKSGSTVSSPVSYVATAATTCSKGVSSMGVYVNNKLIQTEKGPALNLSIALSPGTYSNTVVEEWDLCGGASYTKVPVTVSGTSQNAGVTVTTPAPNSTVTSPVSYAATAKTTCAQGISSMGLYVNNKLIYTQKGAALSTSISLAAGAEHTVVEEWDHCGGAAYTTINLTVTSATKTLKSIAVTPANPSIGVGATQQFTATATYTDGSTANVTSTATWLSTNTAAATITSGGLASGVASGSTQISATLSSITGTDTLSVSATPPPPPGGVNIPTWHVDNNRSGLNNKETSLSLANVAPKTFGKLFSYALDGYAYGEPLVMSGVTINGAKHNVVYVATEHDSVYAFDANSFGSGAPLWHTSLLKSGEAPVKGTIKPWQGVTSTPVIDASSNTIYVVSEQTPSSGGSPFRLNALDITTGAQKFGGPVALHGSVPGTNSTAVNGVVSLPASCIQRAALLLANGNVYMGFGSCHEGWLLAYNAKTLAQVGEFSISPNLNGEGQFASAGGVWMGSGGPVADSAGNVYVSSGNGPWDGKTAFSDSVMKFSPTLKLEDYFTPYDYAFLNCTDGDLASGGVMLIPGTTTIVAGGKRAKMYLVNTANMGKEQANDAGAMQALFFEPDLSAPYSSSCTDASGTHTTQSSSYEIYGTSAYFNGSVYLGVTPTTATAPAGVREFVYTGSKLTYGAETKPSIQEESRGTSPFISADGNANGILWMVDQGLPLQLNASPTKATLRAYDANDLGAELYNSSQNSADVPGYGIRFGSPVVADGRVFFSTGHDLPTVANPKGELDVYGLK